MFQLSGHRLGHYALLLTVASVLSFSNLGSPSLWDIDEANNAECAREMLESANWVIPTFNYQLRVDKPALLYWLQIGAYNLFGVNEFAARMPSALAALAAVLLTYELGRRMYGASAGLLAGLVLSSAIAFCASAHFANPDALLNACTVLTLLFFWNSFAVNGRGWFVLTGISTGLGVLAKGPVGVVLPLTVIGLFLLWSGRLRILWDRRLLWGSLAFMLVALPWYVLAAVDTKAEFLRGFILRHNVDRFLSPMEHHGGPWYYYLGVLVLGFVPWSIFLGPAAWHAFLECKVSRGRSNVPAESSDEDAQQTGLPARFLCCWIVVYLLFFSLANTKLPNYILPIYAPISLLTARFLERWRGDLIQLPAWSMNLCLACLGLVGIGATVALLAAGGAVPLSILRGRYLAGLETRGVLGAVPVLGATAAWWFARRHARTEALAMVAVSAVIFVGGLFTWGSVALEAHKAPKKLVQASQARQRDRDIRVGSYEYFQPSLVFYCQREVQRLENEEQAIEFLRSPLPAYLILPSATWDNLKQKVRGPCNLLTRHYDLYRHCQIVVVTNQ